QRSTNVTQGWSVWIRSTGGDILNEAGDKYMFTDPKTIEGIRNLVDLEAKEKVSPSSDLAEKQGGSLFNNGKAAMYIFQYSNNKKIGEKFPELNYEFAQIPLAA